MAGPNQFQMLQAESATIPGGPQQKRETSSYYTSSGSTIPEGSTVTLNADTTFGVGSSIQLSAASADSLIIGIADEDILTLTVGKVLVKGIKENANVATGVAALAELSQSATAGRLEAVAAGTDKSFIQCLTLAAANLATVRVGNLV